MAIDPVCGMTVDPAKAAGSADYAGKKYLFCSKHCLAKFQAEPAKYTKRAAPESAPSGVTYTCPMHPEVVRVGPGSCPKCGMTLEPVTPLAAGDANPELVDMTRRFWVSAVLSVPLLFIAMAPMFGVMQARSYLEFALATPVVLWGGWPFFHKFWLSLKNRSPNMYTLIGLGVGLAYIFSVT